MADKFSELRQPNPDKQPLRRPNRSWVDADPMNSMAMEKADRAIKILERLSIGDDNTEVSGEERKKLLIELKQIHDKLDSSYYYAGKYVGVPSEMMQQSSQIFVGWYVGQIMDAIEADMFPTQDELVSTAGEFRTGGNDLAVEVEFSVDMKAILKAWQSIDSLRHFIVDDRKKS